MSDAKGDDKHMAVVYFEAWVKCPKCEEDYDAIEDEYEGEITRAMCSNNWRDLDIETRCPHCKHTFTIGSFEQ